MFGFLTINCVKIDPSVRLVTTVVTFPPGDL